MTNRRTVVGTFLALAVLLLAPKGAHALVVDCYYDDWLDDWVCDDDGGGGGGGGGGGCDGWGGWYDQCGVCDGDGSSCGGCDGWGGSYDECGVCDGDGSSCGGGCDGYGGSYDQCGVCDGDGSSCGGCDGYGGTVDACGVCNGDGSSCGVDSSCKPSSWKSSYISSYCSGGCEECFIFPGPPPDPGGDAPTFEFYRCELLVSLYNVCPVYTNCCPANPLPCYTQTGWSSYSCGKIPKAYCE